MTPSASTSFLADLSERGFIYQTTGLEALAERMDQGPLTLYAGFDATAPSFHVGNLMIFMALKWFHQRGHHVLVLLGGGTTQVGDPSDKKSARPLLGQEVIEKNLESLKETVHRLFPACEGTIEIVNNKEWLESLSYMDFLKDVGRHFSVNRMMSFEFVRNRLQNNLPLSFLELNYMLLQSYDFLKLYDTKECLLQMGGSDQWANILSGVELIRRVRSTDAFALTCPLLTNAQGTKMGKTVEGAVWLRGDLFSPYDFWQFWRNVDDRDVERFLKLFTFLSLAEINSLTQTKGSALNEAKKVLADHVTTLLHGEEALLRIHKTAETFFGKRDKEDDTADKTIELSEGALGEGVKLLDLLQQVGFASSKGEGRRLIRGGAIKMNNTPIRDEGMLLSPSLWGKEESLKLSAGAKKHLWLKKIST